MKCNPFRAIQITASQRFFSKKGYWLIFSSVMMALIFCFLIMETGAGSLKLDQFVRVSLNDTPPATVDYGDDQIEITAAPGEGILLLHETPFSVGSIGILSVEYSCSSTAIYFSSLVFDGVVDWDSALSNTVSGENIALGKSQLYFSSRTGSVYPAIQITNEGDDYITVLISHVTVTSALVEDEVPKLIEVSLPVDNSFSSLDGWEFGDQTSEMIPYLVEESDALNEHSVNCMMLPGGSSSSFALTTLGNHEGNYGMLQCFIKRGKDTGERGSFEFMMTDPEELGYWASIPVRDIPTDEWRLVQAYGSVRPGLNQITLLASDADILVTDISCFVVSQSSDLVEPTPTLRPKKNNISTRGSIQLMSVPGDLVVNGDFATDSDWTKGSGWSISSGEASYDGSSNDWSTLEQQITGDQTGTTYTLSYEVVASSKSVNTLQLAANSNFGSTSLSSSVGIHTYDLQVTDASLPLIFEAGGRKGEETIALDDVSMVDNSPTPTPTVTPSFTPTSTPTGPIATPTSTPTLTPTSTPTGATATPTATPTTSAYNNLVTNGAFDTDSDWSKGSGWSITSSAASYDGSQSSWSALEQQLTGDQTGITYTLTYCVIASSNVRNSLQLASNSNFGLQSLDSTVGVHSYDFQVVDASLSLIFEAGGRKGDETITLDEISMVVYGTPTATPTPTPTFTPTSTPTATPTATATQTPTPSVSVSLVVNGEFDTDTAWTKAAGWKIDSGSASYDGTHNTWSALEQQITGDQTGVWYTLWYRVVASSSDSGILRLWSSNLGSWLLNSSVGLHGISTQTTNASLPLVLEVGGSDGTGTITLDDVSLHLYNVPTATPTATATETETPTPTATATSTNTPTYTPTATPGGPTPTATTIALSTPTPTLYPPDTCDEETVIDLVNYYRELVGSLPVKEHPSLTQAAVAHTQYLHINNLYTFDEDPANEGFVGETPADRKDLFGYPSNSGGSILFYKFWDEGLNSLVEGIIERPITRIHLFEYRTTEIGFGFQRGISHSQVDYAYYDFGYTDYYPTSTIFYPVEDQTDVPLAAIGVRTHFAEIPIGSQDYIGYQVTVSGPNSVSAVINDASPGHCYLKPVNDSNNLPIYIYDPTIQGNYSNLFVMAATAPLQSNTVYEAHVEGTIDGTSFDKTWHFTTAVSASAPSQAISEMMTGDFTEERSRSLPLSTSPDD